MARENGLITQVNNPVTTGKFKSDNAATGEINYADQNAVTLNLVANQTRVSAEIVITNPLTGAKEAQQLQLLVVVDPDSPPDEGTVRDSETINGNLTVAAGTTVTLKNCTVNGSIANDGKLIVKSKTKINGDVDIKNSSATLIIYDSSINAAGQLKGEAQVKNNSGQISMKKSIINGDVDIKNQKTGGSIIIDGLTISGSTSNFSVRNNKGTTSIKNVTIQQGDVTIKNNDGCNYSNVATNGGTIDISGCTLG